MGSVRRAPAKPAAGSNRPKRFFPPGPGAGAGAGARAAARRSYPPAEVGEGGVILFNPEFPESSLIC